MNLQLVYRYILSLSKNENLFTKKKIKTRQKDKKKKNEKRRIQRRESNPGPLTCRVDNDSLR